MTDGPQDSIDRRAFLAAAASGIAAFAGCSSTGNNSSTPTSTHENSGTSEPQQSQTQSQTTTADQQYAESDELSEEKQYEKKALNNGYSFIEVAARDIQVSKMEQTPTEDEPDDPYELLKYHFRDFYARNGDPRDSIIFGYDMEPSGDSRNMSFRDFAESDSSNPVSDTPGYSGTYKETAIKRFFDENVSGVVDVSENFPDELLELAAQ